MTTIRSDFEDNPEDLWDRIGKREAFLRVFPDPSKKRVSSFSWDINLTWRQVFELVEREEQKLTEMGN